MANSDVIGQSNAAGGAGPTTGGSNVPINDIAQLPPSAQMYSSGTDANNEQQLYGLSHRGAAPGAQEPKGVQYTTASYWMNYFYTQIASSPQALQRFTTEAQLAQLTGPSANVAQLYSAWQKLIVQAYNHNINGQDMTPWDILASSIPGVQAGSYTNNSGQAAMQNMTAAQAAAIASKAAAANTQKDTQTSEVDINYTDPDTARYVLNQASQQLLGRDATNTEIAAFTKNLNNDERLFPKMTQDTKSVSGSTTSATTPGQGVGASTSEAGAQGQVVVSYDSAGNPIYGPSDPTTTNTSNQNTTNTVVSLGEQDYTRYGRQQLAEDAAKSAPDYGAYQAAGPLFQAFLGALKGAVPGVGSNQ